MGDDTTYLEVTGVGISQYSIHGKTIRQQCYLVPHLGTTLLSMKQHVSSKGCYFHAEAKNTQLAFPLFVLFPRVASEIEVIITPVSNPPQVDFDEHIAEPVNTSQVSSIQYLTKSYSLVELTVANFIPANKITSAFQHSLIVKCVNTSIPYPNLHTSGNQSNHVIRSPTTLAIPPKSSTAIHMGLHFLQHQQLTVQSKHHDNGRVHFEQINGELCVTIQNDTNQLLTIEKNQILGSMQPILAKKPGQQLKEACPSSHQQHCATPTISRSLSKRTHQQAKRLAQSMSQYFQLLKENTRRNLQDLMFKAPFSSLKPTRRHCVSPLPTIPEHEQSILKAPKPHLSLPKLLSFPQETLLKSIGFRDPSSITDNLKKLGKPTISFEKDKSPEVDEGEIASLKANQRNTTPSTIPRSYNKVWNIDIGFGPTVGIGGVKYTLMCVDQAT